MALRAVYNFSFIKNNPVLRHNTGQHFGWFSAKIRSYPAGCFVIKVPFKGKFHEIPLTGVTVTLPHPHTQGALVTRDTARNTEARAWKYSGQYNNTIIQLLCVYTWAEFGQMSLEGATSLF